MDFILKKIVSMFIMPFPIGMLLIMLGLFLLYKNSFKKAKFVLSISFVWMFLISYSPLVNTLLYSYEKSYPMLKEVPKNIRYIHVLGGGHHTDTMQPITSQINEASVVRLNEGIRLYQELNGNATIVLSGYSGLFDPTPHAFMQEKLALALGVKKEHIILLPKPRDTQEEAIAIKKLIGNEAFILVTSASHMRRSMNFFKHEGLNPIPAPTNHLASVKYINYTDIFSVNALRKSKVLCYEIIGLLWQKIKGV